MKLAADFLYSIQLHRWLINVLQKWKISLLEGTLLKKWQAFLNFFLQLSSAVCQSRFTQSKFHKMLIITRLVLIKISTTLHCWLYNVLYLNNNHVFNYLRDNSDWIYSIKQFHYFTNATYIHFIYLNFIYKWFDFNSIFFQSTVWFD